jgi:hypothetical protein
MRITNGIIQLQLKLPLNPASLITVKTEKPYVIKSGFNHLLHMAFCDSNSDDKWFRIGHISCHEDRHFFLLQQE